MKGGEERREGVKRQGREGREGERKREGGKKGGYNDREGVG